MFSTFAFSLSFILSIASARSSLAFFSPSFSLGSFFFLFLSSIFFPWFGALGSLLRTISLNENKGQTRRLACFQLLPFSFLGDELRETNFSWEWLLFETPYFLRFLVVDTMGIGSRSQGSLEIDGCFFSPLFLKHALSFLLRARELEWGKDNSMILPHLHLLLGYVLYCIVYDGLELVVKSTGERSEFVWCLLCFCLEIRIWCLMEEAGMDVLRFSRPCFN